MQEMQVWSLGQEDPLEKEMAIHSRYSCLGNPMDRGAWWATVHDVARVRHNWATKPSTIHSLDSSRGHRELTLLSYATSLNPLTIFSMCFQGNSTISTPFTAGHYNIKVHRDIPSLYYIWFKMSLPDIKFFYLLINISKTFTSVYLSPKKKRIIINFFNQRKRKGRKKRKWKKKKEEEKEEDHL